MRWDRPAGFLSRFPEFLSSKFPNSFSEFLSFGLAPFGFRLLLLALPSSALALDTNKIPDLRPPLTELPPTFDELPRLFFEQHFQQIVWLGPLAIIGVLLLIRVLTPPPWTIARPGALARRALKALRGRPDDVAIASEVARQLRRFTQVTLNLPPGELTTEELLSALRHQLFAPSPSPELHDALARLLRDCDALHFAPVTPAVGPGFAARALEIVRQIEAQLQKTSIQSAAVPESAGNSQRQ